MARLFTGITTALVTPFTEDDKIDFEALSNLVDEQIAAGCNILINGTTGESPTIEEDEFVSISKFVIEIVNKKVKVILGTGSNNTKHTIAKSKLAEELGADGVLVVNPYYNKPTQEGLYQHFKATADAIAIPLIVYNIKGRTGVNVETETLMRLAEIKNIVGVKEASGDIAQIQEVCKKRPEDFSVLLGDDGLIFDCMTKFGADGGISVISNLKPVDMVSMVSFISAGDLEEAKSINDKNQPLMSGLLSISSNPMPVKTVLAEQGKIKEIFRLPMCSMSDEQKEELIKLV